MKGLAHIKRNSKLIYLIFLLVLLTLSNFIYTGFATNDDYEYYLRYYNDFNVWNSSYEYAKMNGRFYFIFMQPLFNIIFPYSFGSIIVTRVVNLLLIAIGSYAFALNLKLLFKDEKIPYLFTIFFYTFLTIKGPNNPIVSYPFYFSTSWILFNGSLYYFVKFLTAGYAKHKIIALIYYSCALLFYEVYLIYSIVFLVVAYIFLYQKGFRTAMVFSLKANNLFVIVNVFYFGVYFVFKKYLSYDLYDGVTINDKFNLLYFFKALGNLPKGAIPLHLYFSGHSLYHNNSYIIGGHVQNILTPLKHIKIEWLIKFILVATSMFLLRNRIDDVLKKCFDKRQKIMWFLLSVSMVFMPHFLLALTTKYQRYTNMGMDNYVTTYFSSFIFYAWLVFAYLSILTIRVNWVKNVLFVVFTLIISYSAILVDYSNYYAKRDLRKVYDMFSSIDALAKCSDFQKINNGSIIVAPDLFNLNSDISYYNAGNFNLSEYFKIKSGKSFSLQRNDSLISPKDSNYYYLTYKSNSSGYYYLISNLKENKTTLFLSSTKPTQVLRYMHHHNMYKKTLDLIPKTIINTYKIDGVNHDGINVSDN